MFVNKRMSQKKSKWSGGVTTELMISPFDSTYKNMDFNFRISSASIEVDHSTFTPLPGVHRQIMSLDNELKLINKESSITLKPFEVYEFDGGVKTESEGRVIDFNLMTRNGYKGELKAVELKKGESKRIITSGLYILKGEINIDSKNYGYHDFVFIDNGSIVVKSNTTLILVSIKQPNRF